MAGVDADEGEEIPDSVPIVAGVAPIEDFLARNEHAAIVLQGVRARRDGFQVTVRAYWRVPEQPLAAWSSTAEYPAAVGVGGDERSAQFPQGFGRDTELDADGNLRPGFIRFAVRLDDVEISNVACMAWTLDKKAPRPDVGMWPISGHGSAYGPGTYGWHDSTYWIWPLPEHDVTFASEWPAFGLVGAGSRMSAQPLVEAASRARPVWDDWTNLPTDSSRARRHPLA